MLVGGSFSYVYFIRCPLNGLVKIGVAVDPGYRFSTLRCGSPVPLERVALMPGTVREERQLHVRFRAHREHGEWFRPGPDLLAYIAGNTTPWAAEGETPAEIVHARRDRAADRAYADILEFDRDTRRLQFDIARRTTKRSEIIGLA